MCQASYVSLEGHSANPEVVVPVLEEPKASPAASSEILCPSFRGPSLQSPSDLCLMASPEASSGFKEWSISRESCQRVCPQFVQERPVSLLCSQKYPGTPLSTAPSWTSPGSLEHLGFGLAFTAILFPPHPASSCQPYSEVSHPNTQPGGN